MRWWKLSGVTAEADPFHGMKPKIGVMGSCSEPISDYARRRAYELGEAIARAECVLVTGASPGLPYEAVRGAKAQAGMTIGISPGLSLAEHIAKYDSPCQGFDVLIYTGSGLMGREVENIRNSDIVIIAGGRSGTLGEFAIAYDEGQADRRPARYGRHRRPDRDAGTHLRKGDRRPYHLRDGTGGPTRRPPRLLSRGALRAPVLLRMIGAGN